MDSNKCTCGCGYSKSECSTGRSEGDRYMFFDNLKTIKAEIDALLQMDPEEVTNLLNNGHDWAGDHIATSTDDIQEVAEFLRNNIGDESKESDHSPFAKRNRDEVPNVGGEFVHTFESFNRIVESITKKYGATISLENFKKLKKGQKVVYKGTPYTIEKLGEHTITLTSEDGKTKTINYNMFNKGIEM